VNVPALSSTLTTLPVTRWGIASLPGFSVDVDSRALSAANPGPANRRVAITPATKPAVRVSLIESTSSAQGMCQSLCQSLWKRGLLRSSHLLGRSPMAEGRKVSVVFDPE
jgi:hypothetical protein